MCCKGWKSWTKVDVLNAIFVVLNVVAAVCYLACFGVAIYVGVNAKSVKAALDAIEMGEKGWKAASVAGTLILSGIMTNFVCCCVWKRRSCAIFYTVAAGVITIFAIIAAVLASHTKHETEQNVKDNLQPSFQTYIDQLQKNADDLTYEDGNQTLLSNWDLMQSSSSCCGIYGPGDFAQHNVSTPDSCYAGSSSRPTLHWRGCKEVVYDNHISKLQLLEDAQAFCGALEAVLGILSLMLAVCDDGKKHYKDVDDDDDAKCNICTGITITICSYNHGYHRG